jgi:D-alanyl-D-alanine carboxypeptidase
LRAFFCFVLLAAIAAAPLPAFSAPAGDAAMRAALKKDLTDYLSSRSKPEHISTLSLDVSFRGDPADVSMAVGTMRFGGGRDVTPNDLFQTGSNTKSFTAALILRLEQAGKLSIEDPVSMYLPQYPAYGKAKIRQLLNMTSGIPTYDDTDKWMADVTGEPMTKPTLADLVAYVYPTMKTPGGEWKYSNTGYIMCQMIIDKLSPSHSYKKELDALIAASGLSDTYYEDYFYPAAIQDRIVAGYEVNTDDKGMAKLIGQDTSKFSLGWAQAAGAMVSTPKALSDWVRKLFEGNVLKTKQLAELETLVAIPSGKPVDKLGGDVKAGFGLGVFKIDDPNFGTFWAYQGSTIGYRATYNLLTKSGTIISVFTNSQTTKAENKISEGLFKTLYATLKQFGKV